MITKIITKGIGLFIEADVPSNVTLFPGPAFTADGRNMLRSRCLDLKWTYVGLFADNDIDTNVTNVLSLTLVKLYYPEKHLRFSNMLSSIGECAQSTWEISVYGQWLSFDFNFPSIQTYGRKDPTRIPLTAVSSRPNTKANVPYYITKLDFCQQVGLRVRYFLKYKVLFI